jgi:hypothetical protein
MNDDQTPDSELDSRFADIESKLDGLIAELAELEEQAQSQKIAFESELAALRLEIKRIKNNA